MDYLRELAFPVASGYALFLWGLSVMIYHHRGALYLLCGGWLASCVVRSMSLSPELERLGYGLSMALCSWLAFRLLGDLRTRFALLGGAALFFFSGTFYIGGAMLLLVGLFLMGVDIDDVERRRAFRLVGVLFESEGAYVLISYFSPLADVVPLVALIGSVGFLMYFLLSSDTMSPKARSVLNFGLLLFTLFTLIGAVTVKKMEDDFREGLLQESYRRLEMTKGKLVFFEMMGVSMAKTVASDPLALSALSSSGFGSDIQLRIINRRLGSSLVFITDVLGDVVATSDPSLRGHNFSFRGYFKQAMSGQNGLLYAMGAVTDKVGAYFSRPLVDRQGQILGVVVVKMDLNPVFGEVFRSESIFMRRGETVLMGPEGLKDCPLCYLSVSMPLPAVEWNLVKLVPKRLVLRYTRILVSFYLLFAAVALLALFRYVQKDQLIGELQREVADRQAAEDSERRARAEAEEANRAKSGFLANMSHEIRTPLNAVLGMAGLLLDTELDHRQGHYARIIQTSGESLLGLINDILDFSKIEADKMELESLDFDLQVLLEDVVEMLSHRAEEKGIGLSYAMDSDVPRFLRGDPVRIRQILVNLVGNGVKFTSQGEVKIKVSLYSSVGDAFNVRFSVVDTGIGIPSERVGALFDAFEQVDSTTTRRFGGTGLGLAISRRLVELMGGRIGVKSVEGSGSDFWFNLPLPVALEEVREDRISREILLGKKALLVDDTSDNLLVLSERLGGWGMISEMCSSPTDSLRIVQGNPDRFDLLILDVQMPEMDGISLARSIRDVSSVPILFLSSIGGYRYDIRLRADEGDRNTPEKVSDVAIRGADGNLIKLPGLITPQIELAPNVIKRHNRQRSLEIGANTSGISPGEGMAQMEEVFKKYAPADGSVTMSPAGDTENMRESFASLTTALAFAILLVYMVMAIQFESFLHPLTVMFSLPLMTAGAFGLLLLAGIRLSVMSFMGIILLVGIVVNNAILLVDFTNQRREQGLDKVSAILEAAPLRMRPILMTTCSTMVGMLPIALGLSEGGEIRQPMSVAVIGGLITSTLLTLVVIPIIYLIIDDISDKTKRMFSKISAVIRGRRMAASGNLPKNSITLERSEQAQWIQKKRPAFWRR